MIGLIIGAIVSILFVIFVFYIASQKLNSAPVQASPQPQPQPVKQPIMPPGILPGPYQLPPAQVISPQILSAAQIRQPIPVVQPTPIVSSEGERKAGEVEAIKAQLAQLRSTNDILSSKAQVNSAAKPLYLAQIAQNNAIMQGLKARLKALGA